MKYIIFFSVLLVFCFTFSVCKKDDPGCPPGLPCATQTGENTFGCYIDGEPWVAEIAPNIWDPTVHKIEAQYDESNYGMDYKNFLYLKGGQYNDSINGFLSISIRPLKTEGLYFSNQVEYLNASGLITYLENGQTLDAVSFTLDTFYYYSIEITHLDTIKKIVAGRFAFTGTSLKDTVIVTDGRFDVKYDPY